MYRKINEETVAFQAGNTARRHFVRDHLGSVRAVVDDAGTVLETASFNVYDFGARLYDPALGRWLSQDPLAEKYQAHSPYLFCAGNPMRFVDPEGKVIAVREFLEGDVHSYIVWSLIIDTAGSSLYFNPQGTTSYNMLPPSNRYKY